MRKLCALLQVLCTVWFGIYLSEVCCVLTSSGQRLLAFARRVNNQNGNAGCGSCLFWRAVAMLDGGCRIVLCISQRSCEGSGATKRLETDPPSPLAWLTVGLAVVPGFPKSPVSVARFVPSVAVR